MSTDTQSIPVQFAPRRELRPASIASPLLTAAIVLLAVRVLWDELAVIGGWANIDVPLLTNLIDGPVGMLVTPILFVIGVILLRNALVRGARAGAEVRVVSIARRLTVIAFVGMSFGIIWSLFEYFTPVYLYSLPLDLGGEALSYLVLPNYFLGGYDDASLQIVVTTVIFGLVAGFVMLGTVFTARRIGYERGKIQAPANYRAPGSQPLTVDLNGTTQGGTNGVALAAFIVMFFSSIVGMILGYVALSQIRQTNQGGRRMALAAVWVGWASIAVTFVWLIVLLVLTLNH